MRRDINDGGWVVGALAYTDAGGSSSDNAALWLPAGGVIELRVPRTESRANGINNRGQVVGQAKGEQSRFAFVWENGVLTDLNSVLAEPLSNVLIEAYDINDAGQIVCGDAYGHSYILTRFPNHQVSSLCSAE